MPKKVWVYIVYCLTLISILSVLSLYSLQDREELKIIVCDVGQGDAILIQKQSTQILIDGGPNASVIDCLSKFMPFWDRQLELVVLTHPQKDHHGGLKQVFEQYKIKNYLTTTAENNESQDYQDFLQTLVRESTNQMIANVGMRFTISSIEFEILSSFKNSSDVNNDSIVMLMKYGGFDGLFTGDIGPKVSDDLSGNAPDVEYLKLPHHGSKNGLSEKLLNALSPEIAVISVGRKNRFGHPHGEITNMLEERKINYYLTSEVGNVVVTTDGKSYTIK